MSNFPKLIPAFSCFIVLDPPVSLGSVSSTGPLTLAPFTSNAGSLKSEQGYPISVDATIPHGSDYIRADTSGKHVRLEVSSVLKDKSGAVIKFSYSGIIALSEGAKAVLTGQPTMKTTEFGDAITHVLFETGNEELRALEQNVYVASGRFVVEEGKNLTVEYKISQVAA